MYANGEENSEIVLSCGEFISHSQDYGVELKHTFLSETKDGEFPIDTDFSFILSSTLAEYGTLDSVARYLESPAATVNESSENVMFINESSNLGIYEENFNDEQAQDWFTQGVGSH